MRRVSTNMIRPHMSLARSIYYNDRLLLKKGCKDVERYVSSLEGIGIYHIYIEDELSEGIDFSEAITTETRDKCIKTLKTSMKSLITKGAVDINKMSDCIENLMDELMENSSVLISLDTISATDDETFIHSISTTVYSLLIASQLGYNRNLLKKLAMGTLLHDIGKTIINKDIMFKKGKLTKEEFQYVKQHTVLGYEALKKSTELPELSRIIALTHHEKLDGSGYPQGLTGRDLHEFTRIATIADMYDALTMDRCYRKSWSAKSAAEYIIENSADKLDAKLAALLLQQVALYPNGTIVTLSNNCTGLVKEQNQSMPLHPIIRILKDEYGQVVSPYDFDLYTNLNVVIVSSEEEISEMNINTESVAYTK